MRLAGGCASLAPVLATLASLPGRPRPSPLPSLLLALFICPPHSHPSPQLPFSILPVDYTPKNRVPPPLVRGCCPAGESSQGNSQRAGLGRRRGYWSELVYHSPQISPCSSTWKFFEPPPFPHPQSFWVFMEAALHRHD